MIGAAWALLNWQLRLAAVLVVVLAVLLATLVGGYVEWSRAGGTRDLEQQLAAVRGLLAGYSATAADAHARADRFRRAADAEHARADRERSMRMRAERDLAELRAHAVDVIDLALSGHPPP